MRGKIRIPCIPYFLSGRTDIKDTYCFVGNIIFWFNSDFWHYIDNPSKLEDVSKKLSMYRTENNYRDPPGTFYADYEDVLLLVGYAGRGNIREFESLLSEVKGDNIK